MKSHATMVAMSHFYSGRTVLSQIHKEGGSSERIKELEHAGEQLQLFLCD